MEKECEEQKLGKCKYSKIIYLLEKRMCTMANFLILFSGIFIFEHIILLCLIYILANH